MTTKKSSKKNKTVSKKKANTQSLQTVKVEPSVSLSRLLVMFSPTDILNMLLEDSEKNVHSEQEMLDWEKANLKTVSSREHLEYIIEAYGDKYTASSEVSKDIKEGKKCVNMIEKELAQKKTLVSALKVAKKAAEKSKEHY